MANINSGGNINSGVILILGHILNNLGKVPIEYVTHQLTNLDGFDKKIFKCFLLVAKATRALHTIIIYEQFW